MNDATPSDADEAPPRVEQRPDGLWWPEALLRSAARFSRTPGRSATLVLRRRPGLVARARAVADDVRVDAGVVVEAAGPTITLTTRRGPAAPSPAPSTRCPASVVRSTALVRADRP